MVMVSTSEYGPQKMHWFVTKRDHTVVIPYEAFIYCYDPGLEDAIIKVFRGDNHSGFNEGDKVQAHNMDALNECFTEIEIEQFKEYLKYDETPHVREIDLPFYNHWGFGVMADLLHDLYYDMSKEPGYNLPFVVHGLTLMY